MHRARAASLHPLLIVFAACAPEDRVEPQDSDPTPEVEETRCTTDAECDDGNPCNGDETCDAEGACEPGVPVDCPTGEQCTVQAGAPVCAVVCDLPHAPVLTVIAEPELLTFTLPTGVVAGVETWVADDGPIPDPVPWEPDDTVTVSEHADPLRVLARSLHPDCTEDDRFDHTWAVAPTYPPGSNSPDHQGIPLDDPQIAAWATGVASVTFGDAVDETWRDTDRALGPAAGTSTDVVSLGEGGQITLTFDTPIADGPGPDFAVYENGFSDTFLEYGYVEVSSDGSTFVRFDSAFLGTEPVGPFADSDPTLMLGLAGRYRQGIGTGFDLSLLRWHPLVRRGLVDLQRVTHVRIVDVVGDGSDLDSFGRPIYDPYPTTGSAGFDLDAIAVLHEAP